MIGLVVTVSAILAVLVSAVPYQEEIIAGVRENGGDALLWEPGVNFDIDAPKDFFHHLAGNLSIESALDTFKASSDCESHCAAEAARLQHDHHDELPENFDARQKYPQCPSIGKVHDQGACKADYAISTASAITDRLCIASGGKTKTPISAQRVVSCCQDCGRGCRGGIPQEVWRYFVRRGITSGGAYNSNEGCQPYLIEPTGFAPNKFYGSTTYKTPACRQECYNQQYGKSRARDDLHKGKDAARLCCCSVKDELVYKGPATTSMLLFEDFLTYKSGIYHHVHGKRLGHISVKVIGYGVENKTPYWLAVNSWSEKWGDKGTFKILKGEENGVEFEDHLFAANIPK